MIRSAFIILAGAFLFGFVIAGCEPASESVPERETGAYPEPQERHIDPSVPGAPPEPRGVPAVPREDRIDPEEHEVSPMLKGNVRYQSIEGGFYGLIDDQGNRYNPINLPEDFRQDGLAVKFRVRYRPDIMTIRMWGKTVEIVEIEPLQ